MRKTRIFTVGWALQVLCEPIEQSLIDPREMITEADENDDLPIEASELSSGQSTMPSQDHGPTHNGLTQSTMPSQDHSMSATSSPDAPQQQKEASNSISLSEHTTA